MGLQLTMRKAAIMLLLALVSSLIVGCDGEQVVHAPSKRPNGMGMAHNTPASGTNQGN